MSCTSLFDAYLAIFTQVFLRFSYSFFAHPINLKELVVFYIFQGLIHISKDNFTKFQDKRHFFPIPGVFQDQGQIQGLFQVCANTGQGYTTVFMLNSLEHVICPGQKFKRTKLFQNTVKPVTNGHSQKDHKLVFKTNYPLMQVNGSILQYF